jgi:hypothetical protein
MAGIFCGSLAIGGRPAGRQSTRSVATKHCNCVSSSSFMKRCDCLVCRVESSQALRKARKVEWNASIGHTIMSWRARWARTEISARRNTSVRIECRVLICCADPSSIIPFFCSIKSEPHQRQPRRRRRRRRRRQCSGIANCRCHSTSNSSRSLSPVQGFESFAEFKCFEWLELDVERYQRSVCL